MEILEILEHESIISSCLFRNFYRATIMYIYLRCSDWVTTFEEAAGQQEISFQNPMEAL
jgi:hypothetical protein